MTEELLYQRPHKPFLGIWAWVVIGIFLCAMACAIGTWGAVYYLNQPTQTGAKEVEIQKGMTVHQIGQTLYAEGLIRSPKLLGVFARINGTSRRLTAGVHPFNGQMTTWEILIELEQPRDVTLDVTLPEGLRKEQVARILATDLALDENKLLALMSDSVFVHSLGVPARNLEGFLFPETYKISTSSDEEQVLKLLVSHFFEAFDERLQQRAHDIGLTVHEAVIMASIIEGEARIDEERPVISAVYHNRLKVNMRLQADPTVQYALPDGPRRLYYKDYKWDSPYNTYLNNGLPPGAIMNPGKASLEAAVFPADVEYLYFVAKGDGAHLFTNTPEEHEEAKRNTLSNRARTWGRAN